MKDLPVFTTEYGAAGLVLREVPYQQTAYVRIHSAAQPRELLEECVKFCRMVGAEQVFATGHGYLENYPLHTRIIRMACGRASLGDTDAALWPVQEETAHEFQRLYNQKVGHVPNAAWMDDADRRDMLRTGEGYFVHRGDTLLGIGRVTAGEIRFLASLRSGAGADVIRALAHATAEERITVEVATANEKAVKLYEKLGFIPVAELSSWYRVL